MSHKHTGDCDNDHQQVEDISVQVQNAIKALPTLQQKVQAIAINGYLQQKKKLDDDLQKELNQIQIKYHKLCQPIFNKINQIVDGTRTLTDDDFEGVLGLLTEQELDLKKNYLQAQKFKGYWSKVFINSEIGGDIKEKDEAIFQHLYRVQAEKSADETNLTVKFYFSQNEWFSNLTLTKQFALSGQEITKSYGDVINWKEGKNITVKVVKKKQKNKKTGQKKTSTKQVKEQSFFHFFTQIDMGDDQQQDDQQNEEQQKQVEQLQHQYEIANTIYEELIPFSIEYYLGVGGLGEDGLQGLEDIEQLEDQQQQEQTKPKKKKNKKTKEQGEDKNSKQKSKSKSKSKGKEKKTQPAKKQQCKQQ